LARAALTENFSDGHPVYFLVAKNNNDFGAKLFREPEFASKIAGKLSIFED